MAVPTVTANVTADAIAMRVKMTAILHRFVRNYVKTFLLRRALRNARMLDRVFGNLARRVQGRASRPVWSVPAHDPMLLAARRAELTERYAAAASRTSESECECECRSSQHANDDDARVSSSDNEPVTFIRVVQHLTSLVEDARAESRRKDARIAELEHHLARELGEKARLEKRLQEMQMCLERGMMEVTMEMACLPTARDDQSE